MLVGAGLPNKEYRETMLFDSQQPIRSNKTTIFSDLNRPLTIDTNKLSATTAISMRHYRTPPSTDDKFQQHPTMCTYSHTLPSYALPPTILTLCITKTEMTIALVHGGRWCRRWTTHGRLLLDAQDNDRTRVAMSPCRHRRPTGRTSN